MRTEQENQPRNNQQNKVRKFIVDDFDQKTIFLCQFCGGKQCDQENYLKNKIQPNAIEGLHSNWITDKILAMQRPSQRLIKEYNLYAKFKDMNITTVLNLQQPGQHPFCGDGNVSNVGFSYIPERFFAHGIKCFNQCWEDMTSTTFEHMMRIMNLFDMTMQEGGRISVHCHAGRGRTLLVICSWLIYNDRMAAAETIKLATEKRQGVLTKSSQREFLQYFQDELSIRWKSFDINLTKKTFNEFVEWQTTGLINREKKKLHKMPIAHSYLIHNLRKFLEKDTSKLIQALLNPINSLFKQTWGQDQQKFISKIKNEVNSLIFKSVILQKDPRILAQLLFDFYDTLPYTLVTSLTVQFFQDEIKKQSSQNHSTPHLKVIIQPEVIHDIGISTLAVILDYCHFLNEIERSLASKKQGEDVLQESAKINCEIVDALYIRFALLLISKRQYFPQLYPVINRRDCKIYRYLSKIKKVVNNHVIFLADFLHQLAKQLPKQLYEIHKLIFKVCKVDFNLYYLIKEAPEQLLNEEAKRQIYKNARIKYQP